MSFTAGIFCLIGFFVISFGLTLFIASGDKKEEFLVANRNIGALPAAFSIAATWIWAPALFVAAQKAYTQGWVGLFWFTVPNVLCLVVFAHFAQIFRDKFPSGYTISGYMKERYSSRVQWIYHVELIGLSICSFAVQLLAGGLIFSTLTGIPFLHVTLVLSVIALSYSLVSGIRASILTDYVQMAIILIVSAILIPWAVTEAGGISTIVSGLSGISGEYTSLFTGKGVDVFLSFGIAVTIGLFSGPFGDQTFWQRAQSVEKRNVKKAFILGALIFSVVPITMSLLGFVAAGTGMVANSAQLINLEVIQRFLPVWAVFPFTLMLLSGLVSTLDSALCAISSVFWGDIACKGGDSKHNTRLVMVGAAIVAVGIANIPGMQILYLFLFYGTLRASVLIPTVMTLLSSKIKESGMFWGILSSIAIGLPIFAYGKFNGNLPMIIAGSIITVGLSGVIVSVLSFIDSHKHKSIEQSSI